MSTINWNNHWKTEKEPEDARTFALKMADRIIEFIKNKQIRSFADFGCGPATTIFELARIFPEISFLGYDIAGSIVLTNKRKASELQLKNINFEKEALPDIKSGKRYDLVICLSTLHYVSEIEKAVKNLYKLVNPGGYMIFNYPNVYTKKAYQRDIKPGDTYMKNRFALVLAGKNLLSLRRIGKILGIKPKKFYSSRRSNVYTLIYKRIEDEKTSSNPHITSIINPKSL